MLVIDLGKSGGGDYSARHEIHDHAGRTASDADRRGPRPSERRWAKKVIV